MLALVLAAASAVAQGAADKAQPGEKQPEKGAEKRARGSNAGGRPRLVVVIVLDQFRADNLTRFMPYFGEGGFKWLLRNGASLTSAHYTHATTYTGPGHATLLSGSYAHVNGIIGNRWFNRDKGRLESMFYDPDSRLLGLESGPSDETSPRNFIGTNLCDQLLLSNNFKSKAVAISLKDRAAMMLAGKLGKAYWYHEGLGAITSSSFYMKELPSWVREFNARKIPDSYFGKKWDKSLPEAAYSISRADDFPFETDFKGMGKTFPHPLGDKSGKPSPDFYEAFTCTPFGTDYELELARKAIEQEALGADDYPDILGISITGTDIVGHNYGPESQEMQDIVCRTDEQLAVFFDYLNGKFKKGEVLIALTSDHGACPVPEYMASLGVDAGRIKKKQLSDAIEGALGARFGAANPDSKWILSLEDPGVYLNWAMIAERKLDRAEVERAAGEAALKVKGIAGFFTRSQFLNGALPPNRWAAQFEKSFYPERSGDVLLMTKPYYFWGTYGERDTGSTHGSPYEYDTHVPLILTGSGIRQGAYAGSVDMADLAPTLASLLGISAPAGCEGRRLNEILGQ
jgi:predicted AlkP superfamily pyrophosphatase or phosphodiesterase